MAELGPVTVACPMCKAKLDVPTEVVGTDQAGSLVVRMDPTTARQHAAECARTVQQPEAQDTTKAVAPAKAQIPPFVATGNRWCVACKISAKGCLDQLMAGKGACCAMCSEGDSHPAPQQSLSCAEWAAEHGAPVE